MTQPGTNEPSSTRGAEVAVHPDEQITTAPDLAGLARDLVEHLEAEVDCLSQLQFRFDDETMTLAEIRRELGRLLSDGRQGLAIARAFHTVISSAETNNDPIAQTLKDPAAALLSLSAWLDESRNACDAVTLDLTILASLIDHVDRSGGAERAVGVSLAHHVLEDARKKLDRSRPPELTP